MDRDIVRTPVRKLGTLRFSVDGLQVWASCLDNLEGGHFGVMFKWLPHKYASTPVEHVTRDGGRTYHPTESHMLGQGVEKLLGAAETDPEKLKALQRIWTTYQQGLSRDST